MTFDQVLAEIDGYTLLDRERLLSLWNLAHSLAGRGVAGDIVECGAYRGGSSAVLRAAMGVGRRLWVFDSFQGMPETTEEDGTTAAEYVGACLGTEQDVQEILRRTGSSLRECVIRAGWFQDTFKGELPEAVALLHCDADWYDSVTLVLETFYPRVVPGGCVILDDYGYWEGCRRAFYEFCERHGERPLLERVGITQAYWVKGKEHNRGG